MKGYKVFNSDWTCRGFKYEVGKTYKHDGKINICNEGFHFCKKLSDCFNYYKFDSDNKVAEIEAIGKIDEFGDKCITDEITIVKEYTWHEVLDLINEGKGNSGRCNTGDCNTGDCNTGNRNTGDRNTGSWNTGNRNAGEWNSTNYSTGFFNSEESRLIAFNRYTTMNRCEYANLKGMTALRRNYHNNVWVAIENMTDEEKLNNPEYETLGGYSKSIPFKDACQEMWKNMTDEEKQSVKDLPNFDAVVFYDITGIDVNNITQEVKNENM